jgi:hypothetical protein
MMPLVRILVGIELLGAALYWGVGVAKYDGYVEGHSTNN